MDKVRPSLWFDGNAEEAVKFYTSLLPNSRITGTTHYTEAGPLPAGTVLTVEFELGGRGFQAINAGPEFKFNEAISLSVACKDQEEIDRLWDTLTADGGEESVCGWLKDKYGLSWQIAPEKMIEWISDSDRERANRVMQTMMSMKKIDIPTLEKAYKGELAQTKR